MTATGGTQVPIGFKWTAVITVDQTGSTVSGTFETGMGLSGKVSGNVFGDQVSMTINQDPICPGTFHGSAKVKRKKMVGTYSGSDSNGTVEASFIAFQSGTTWECACGIENSNSRSTCSNCKWTREQSEKWKAENPGQGVNIQTIDERDDATPFLNFIRPISWGLVLVGFAYSTCIKPYCNRRAEEQGEVRSQRHLGSVNEEGDNYRKDYTEAQRKTQKWKPKNEGK